MCISLAEVVTLMFRIMHLPFQPRTNTNCPGRGSWYSSVSAHKCQDVVLCWAVFAVFLYSCLPSSLPSFLPLFFRPFVIFPVTVGYATTFATTNRFINKIRILQRSRGNTIGRRSTRVRMTCRAFLLWLGRPS